MRVSKLPFKVIDVRTGREYTEDAVIKDGISDADWLMETDLEGFMICEDGCLAFADECGRYNYINPMAKYEIEIEGYVAIDEVSKLIEKHRKNMNKIDIGPNVETIKALIAEWFNFEIDIIALKEGKDDRT